jgi:hypothetical protein
MQAVFPRRNLLQRVNACPKTCHDTAREKSDPGEHFIFGPIFRLTVESSQTLPAAPITPAIWSERR